MFETRSRLKNTRVEGFEWVRSVWGERKDFLSREKSEKWIWFALRLYKEIVAWWIEVSVEICQALNLDRNKSVEVLSRICQWQKYLDGSRIYWPNRKKFSQWIKEVVKNLLRRNPETSMDWENDKIYRENKKDGLNKREFVEDLSRSCRAWRKQEFFKKGKTPRDECKRQATQT